MVQTEMKIIQAARHTHTLHGQIRKLRFVYECVSENGQNEIRKKERVKRRKKELISSISRTGRIEKCAANKSSHI